MFIIAYYFFVTPQCLLEETELVGKEKICFSTEVFPGSEEANRYDSDIGTM